MPARDLIVIGTSAGGVEALQTIARGLPGDLAAAVLIVMHTSPQGPYLLPEILSKVSSLEVAKTVDGAAIEHGKILRRSSRSPSPREGELRPFVERP